MVEGRALWSVKFEKHGSTKYSVLFPILVKTSESLVYTNIYPGSLRRHSEEGSPHVFGTRAWYDASRESCYLRCRVW